MVVIILGENSIKKRRMDLNLIDISRSVLVTCMDVKEKKNVLIITDDERSEIVTHYIRQLSKSEQMLCW